MIKEDYVSFEIAKLLNKKGFDCECIGYYVYYEPNNVKYSLLGKTNSTWGKDVYSAPTLQMAMKWLREVYNIDISVTPDRKVGYSVLIFKDKRLPFDTLDSYSIYKQACEAAIKYCLENLI